jgi:hypothetical protein
MEHTWDNVADWLIGPLSPTDIAQIEQLQNRLYWPVPKIGDVFISTLDEERNVSAAVVGVSAHKKTASEWSACFVLPGGEIYTIEMTHDRIRTETRFVPQGSIRNVCLNLWQPPGTKVDVAARKFVAGK